jgi:hypothetical protein
VEHRYNRVQLGKVTGYNSELWLDLESFGSRTTLPWAAEQGHEAVVKLQLKIGKVDVGSKDNEGRTPLSRAADRGHKNIVELYSLSHYLSSFEGMVSTHTLCIISLYEYCVNSLGQSFP